MARAEKKAESKEGLNRRARLINRLIFGVALFGMLLTVHLWIQSERNFAYGCFGFEDPAEVGVVECSNVVSSDAGKLFGISNIVYGFFFFATLAILAFATILSRGNGLAKVRRAALIVASIGFAYALYLFGYQVFVLSMFCKLCLTTGLTTAVLFGLHAVEWAGKTAPKFELAELVREVGLFILMIFIALSLLIAELFFINRVGTLAPAQAAGSASMEGAPPPQASAAAPEMSSEERDAAIRDRLDQICHFDPAVATIPDLDGFVSNAASVGSDTASIAIVEFFDPNCPHCKTLHERKSEIMAKVGGRARLYYRPYPIWGYSYQQVEALYLAKDEGLWDEMLDAQMDQQKAGGLSVAELVQIAGEIGMDATQFRRDLNGGKHRSRVNRERVQISQLGITGVPKVAIDGRFVQTSSVNPDCISHLVDRLAEGV